MARKKNKTYQILSKEDVKAIARKAKYSRKQKHKEVYA